MAALVTLTGTFTGPLAASFRRRFVRQGDTPLFRAFQHALVVFGTNLFSFLLRRSALHQALVLLYFLLGHQLAAENLIALPGQARGVSVGKGSSRSKRLARHG